MKKIQFFCLVLMFSGAAYADSPMDTLNCAVTGTEVQRPVVFKNVADALMQAETKNYSIQVWELYGPDELGISATDKRTGIAVDTYGATSREGNLSAELELSSNQTVILQVSCKAKSP